MRQGFSVWAFVLAAGFLLDGDLEAGSLEPPGPPAPTMKTLAEVESRTPISSLPFTISQPGSYYLTGNLTGVAGQVGINVTVSFVTLDLNGFSLIGVPSSLDGIRTSAGTKGLVIRNGAIRNWGGLGVSAFSTSDVHARDLRLDGNLNHGLAVGSGSIVRDTTSALNGGSGIVVDLGGTVIGCTASSNTANGIVTGGWGTVTDSAALLNGTGFFMGIGSRVSNSVARANNIGIQGQDGVSVVDCSAYGNTTDGIRVSSRGLVRGNVVRGNLDDGIQATLNENRIEENESTTNSAAGIRVDGVNNVIVKNSVGSNTTTEYMIAVGNKLGPISADPATAGPWANFDQ